MQNIESGNEIMMQVEPFLKEFHDKFSLSEQHDGEIENKDEEENPKEIENILDKEDKMLRSDFEPTE